MRIQYSKRGRISPRLKHNFKHNLNTMKEETDKNLCHVIDVIKDKINNTERQIDKEIAGIESALENKFYQVAHNKIYLIEDLNDEIRNLHNYLIDTNGTGISSIKTFKDFAWTEPKKSETDPNLVDEFGIWNGLLKVYDVNKNKEITISLAAGYSAYSSPRQTLNYNSYIAYEICIWDNEKTTITDYYDHEDEVCGYKDIEFINNLLIKIQLK